MKEICKYFPCIVSKETGRDCAKPLQCRAKVFYDKYKDYEGLGVGAMTAEGLERLSKQL